MKINSLILLIYIVGLNISKAQTTQSLSLEPSNYRPQSAVIDSLDTVVIDISHGTFFFNCMRIPVSILSDDPIYSLDLNFKYNQNTLQYDSITNLTGYIQAFSFYNAVDSTVRFTSNSIQIYTNDTPLITLNISMLTSNISQSDFYMVNGYLNGDPCIVKIIDPLGVSVSEADNKIQCIVYPNPSNGIIHIKADAKSEIRIIDLNGKNVLPPFIYSEVNNSISTEDLPKGIYMIKIFNEKSFTAKRIFVE